MGNRGTTPSWDDEQIEKYGLFGHLEMVNHSQSAIREGMHKTLIAKHIGKVMSLLPRATMEDRSRVEFAIPEVVNYPHNIRKSDRHKDVAGRIYSDWLRRTRQENKPTFSELDKKTRAPFLLIARVVSKAIGA